VDKLSPFVAWFNCLETFELNSFEIENHQGMWYPIVFWIKRQHYLATNTISTKHQLLFYHYQFFTKANAYLSTKTT